MKFIASCSFGKDSLAMLLKIIELKMPLDEVIFYNTGMEFDAVYQIRNEIKYQLNRKNILYTELSPKCPFIYTMFDKQVNHRDGTVSNGYSWCGGRCRWGTTEKNKTITKYLKEKYADKYFGEKVEHNYSAICKYSSHTYFEDDKFVDIDKCCGWILLNKNYMGSGTVSHECTHAITFYFEYRITNCKKVFESQEYNELLAYMLGSIVNQIYNKMYSKKLL